MHLPRMYPRQGVKSSTRSLTLRRENIRFKEGFRSWHLRRGCGLSLVAAGRHWVRRVRDQLLAGGGRGHGVTVPINHEDCFSPENVEAGNIEVPRREEG